MILLGKHWSIMIICGKVKKLRNIVGGAYTGEKVFYGKMYDN